MKSSKSVKSKQLLLSGLVALVLIAGYYRWTTDGKNAVVPVINEALPEKTDTVKKIETDKANDGESEKMDYFEKSKYDRDLTRSESVAMLQDFSEESMNDEERKKNQEKISLAAVRSEKENVIENLVISKGFEDCVVFMNDDMINVVVKTDKLDAKSANQIKDIILSQTDYKSSQIRLSSKKD